MIHPAARLRRPTPISGRLSPSLPAALGHVWGTNAAAATNSSPEIRRFRRSREWAQRDSNPRHLPCKSNPAGWRRTSANEKPHVRPGKRMNPDIAERRRMWDESGMDASRRPRLCPAPSTASRQERAATEVLQSNTSVVLSHGATARWEGCRGTAAHASVGRRDGRPHREAR